jgi:hypothetical protein
VGFAVIYPQNHQVPWLRHKAKTKGSVRRRRFSSPSGSFEAKAKWCDGGACVGGKQGPIYVCPFDEVIHVLTKTPLHGLEL